MTMTMMMMVMNKIVTQHPSVNVVENWTVAGNVLTADDSALFATGLSPLTWRSTVRDAFDFVYTTAYLASHLAPLNANNVKTIRLATTLLYTTVTRLIAIASERVPS